MILFCFTLIFDFYISLVFFYEKLFYIFCIAISFRFKYWHFWGLFQLYFSHLWIKLKKMPKWAVCCALCLCLFHKIKGRNFFLFMYLFCAYFTCLRCDFPVIVHMLVLISQVWTRLYNFHPFKSWGWFFRPVFTNLNLHMSVKKVAFCGMQCAFLDIGLVHHILLPICPSCLIC